jgi:hypothetical protein
MGWRRDEYSPIDVSRFPDTAAGQLSLAKMAEVEMAMRYCLGL